VILYESLSGRLPFESSVPGTISVREDDRPPNFPADFPAPMRRVVERCLRLSPEARYPSVGDLLEDLGQTARPGDSLRLKPGGAASSSADPKLAREKSTPLADRPASRTEARQTAAELTRGAVEVARGVWDGLRNMRTAPRNFSDPRTPTDPRTRADVRPGSDTPPLVLGSAPSAMPPAIKGRGEESSNAGVSPENESGTPSAPTVLAPAEPAGAEAPKSDTLVIYSLEEGRGFSSAGSAGPSPPVIEFEPASALFGTIPVPPAGKGGWLGTLRSSLVLAVEVLISLLRGLVRKASGGSARTAAHTVGAGVWRIIRVLGFVLLLAFLGGFVTWIVIMVLKDRA
jgi:serine/threonine protein kinase